MRATPFALIATVVLLGGGLAVFLSAKPNKVTPTIGFGQPKHPVTAKMTEEAKHMDLKTAPAFVRKTVAGPELHLSGGNLARPQFVLFILDGCPCSIDAQPIFNGFAKHWKGKVDFIGVIDSEGRKAQEWVADYKPAFPVMIDSKKEIIHAYEAKQSVYSALIATDGKVVKLWPGYSIDMMKEMNDLIAKELGVEGMPFDTQYAPKIKTSGCEF